MISVANLVCGILLTFVELNCENLFDCQHDTLKQDQEFLPNSTRHWTTSRYWKKVNNIGQEIIACGESSDGWKLPDLVALCEVENDSVCRDLTKRSLLRKAGYEYVVTQSPDLRGIDVALLYNPFTFRMLNHQAIRVEPLADMRPTRDILYVEGVVATDDTLHVFVVHAPSRFGGESVTRPHRKQVGDRLSLAIDSVRSIHPQAKIIVTGDMNDPHDGHLPQQIESFGLTNVSRGVKGTHGAHGTYKYHGLWQSIDHFFVSRSLLLFFSSCIVLDASFLVESDDVYNGVRPLRSYHGMRYGSGFSDHLPLVARFVFGD
ncbi:MAG: endonuclease/exonuclease/phosphatase family protein [Prevotella sp.]|nr:endonuclease/exonuclease/phosphatase family protein [Prevotella sp.]